MMPSRNHASIYAAITHYLKAIKAAGTDDAAAVGKAMRAAPVAYFGHPATMRSDGRVMYDITLYRVKTPAESKAPWDYYAKVRDIPADGGVPPAKHSGLRAVKRGARVLEFPIIDSHVHLLDQQRFGYAWSAGAPALKRDWGIDDLARSAKPYNLEGLVFVEVDVDMPQYLDEADWVEATAETDKRLKGAVVCLPLERGPALEPEIARVAKLKVTRGVRRLIQNQPDPEYVLRPDFLGGAETAAEI